MGILNAAIKAILEFDTPPHPEEIGLEYRNDMQLSLTAYFRAHSHLDPNKALPENLAIPWVSAPRSGLLKSGFLVATGKMTERKNWHVFQAISACHSSDAGLTADEYNGDKRPLIALHHFPGSE